MYLKEARKGAFRPEGMNTTEVLAAFCKHVEVEFEPSRVMIVVDCLPYFRKKALEQAGDKTPLAALILYAAWGEHWVNVIVTIGMLRGGDSEHGVQAYFRTQPRFENKIATIRRVTTAGPPKKELDWLIQVMKTRNEYLHYTWEGRPQRSIDLSFKGVAALIKKAEAMLDGLLAYETKEFDASLQPLARKLFPAAR